MSPVTRRKDEDPPVLASAAGPAPAIDFVQLVGRVGWQRLAPDIRARFQEKPAPGRPIRYVGIMEEVRASLPGRLLAWASWGLGSPFAAKVGTNVPVAITLSLPPSGDAVIWERVYRFPRSRPVTVRSAKRTGPDGQTLDECVDGGFAMRLRVFEAGGALHFRSLGYIWRLGSLRVRLPDLLSPGQAWIIHRDLGLGRFRFTMTISHPVFGTLFHQDGVFRREGVTS